MLPSKDVPVPKNDGHVMARADADDLLHILGRLRKDDGIGGLGRNPGRRVGVLLSNRP